MPARLVHVGPIANRMRDADRVECEAFGHQPRAALRAGLIAGKAWTALVDGRPEAMFGVVPVNAMAGEGRPWMLGTDAIYRHGRDLLRIGPALLAGMFDSSSRLSNLVAAGNGRAIRLLKRWGFTIGADVVTIGGVAFHEFEGMRDV